MTSFLNYRKTKSAINETTVPEHLLHIPQSWDHHSQVSKETSDKISNALNGRTHISFPLSTEHHDADADVVDHLSKHGYTIKDYTKGIASSKKMVGNPDQGIPMREKIVDEKIGSILDKTGAEPHVKSAFMNDPVRSSSKFASPSSKHHVVITTSPNGIAGSSTGTSWNSCMNLNGGEYTHHLENDSMTGTHVAYLVPHDDHEGIKNGEPSKPIARISLKAFHEHDGHDYSNDTIYRPENVSYGNGNMHFANAINQWANEHYPAKEGTTYHKNRTLYNDDGNFRYKTQTKSDIENKLNSGEDLVENSGDYLDKHLIDHALAHLPRMTDELKSRTGAIQLARVGNLNSTHTNQLFNMSDKLNGPLKNLSKYVASLHGDKLSSNNLTKVMPLYPDGLPNKVLMNSKLPDSVIDSLPSDKLQYVRKSKIKDHHVDKAIADFVTGATGSETIDHLKDKLGESHIHKLIAGDPQYAAKLGDHPNFNKEHHDKLVSRYISPSAAHNLIAESPHTTIEDAKKLEPAAGLAALQLNKHNTPEVQKALKDHIVSSIKNDRYGPRVGIPGFGGVGALVDKSVSKHFTDDDYKTVGSVDKSLSFGSPEHSAKYLDGIMPHVNLADRKITEYKNSPAHDPSKRYDSHLFKLHSDLFGHLSHLGNALDKHIENHIKDSSGDYINNYPLHAHAQNLLSKVDKLKNYHNDSKSDDFSEKQDHYDDNLREHSETLKTIKRNSEDRDNGYNYD